jgi:hypothetical protein
MHFRDALTLTVLCLAPIAGSAVDPYESRQDRSYRALSGSIQRAFAVPSTGTTVTPYRSNITQSSNSYQRSSERPSAGGSGGGGASDSNSWGMPSRQPGFNWGPGYVPPGIDADDRRIFRARNAVWKLPKPPLADLAQITRYYANEGVTFDRAREAAKADIDNYEQALRQRTRDAAWQAHDAKLAAQRANVQAQRKVNAQFQADFDVAKRRALASNNMEDARAWLGVYTAPAYKNTYIERNRDEFHEVALFAAQRGVPEAYSPVWNHFARTDPAGHEWRDKAAVVGDVAAAQEAFAFYAKTPPTRMAAAVALFEKVHETQSLPTVLTQPDPKHKGLGRALAAGYLAQILASGDTTLQPDLLRAIEWLKTLPLAVPAGWQEWGYLVDQAAVTRLLTANPMAARQHQAEILAHWEDLGRRALDASGGELSRETVVTTLYGIYSGQERALPTAISPAKADAMWAWLEPRINWYGRLRFAVQARDWKRAASLEEPPPGHKMELHHLEMLGRLWLERSDGRADASKAVSYFEKARYTFSNPVPLVNAYLAAGNQAMALQTLQRGGVQSLDKWRVLLRWAQLHYRGEAGPISVAEGDAMMAQLRASMSSPKSADELALTREVEFETVAGPMLARYKLINAAANADANGGSTKAEQALARQHRANFEPALPRLRELAFGGDKAAMRLWAVVTLGGDVPTTPEDAVVAKNTLYLDAQGGDATAVSILAQRLYLDAQTARGAQPPAARQPQQAQHAQFSEAADWLEASLKSGDDSARWPLATIYSEGLGRNKSLPKAREQLKPLAAAGDPEARLTLAKWSASDARTQGKK